MSNPIQPLFHDLLDETLARLSKKPGVKATLVINRLNGAVMKSSGNLTALQPSTAHSAKTATAATTIAAAAAAAAAEVPGSPSPIGTGAFTVASTAVESDQEVGMRGAVEYARLIWEFVKAAGGLVDDLEDEGELKLLRLRMKRQELVIVPDAKYLLVLVHDTPSA